MSSLRILHVTNNYRPYAGGLVSSLDAHREALQAEGHQSWLATLDFLGDRKTDAASVFRLKCPIRFTYCGNHMAIPWRAKKQLIQLMRACDPDIVHVHHPFLLGSAALKSAHALNIPVIFTFHTRYQDYLHYVPAPGAITASLCNFLVKKFCALANGIIAPSSSIITQLEAMDLTCKIACIPSPVLPFFTQSEPLIKSVHQPMRLLTVSRLVPEKNIFFLLNLMTKLPKSYQLTIIGRGWLEHELRIYAYQRSGLSEQQVIFKHIEDKQHLRVEYAKADLFLFASQTETQGIVLAEALASSCPIIALRGPGIVDVVQEGINGFIVHDQTQMIQRIKQVQHDAALMQSLQYGAWRSSYLYSSSAIIQRVVDFYRLILQAK